MAAPSRPAPSEAAGPAGHPRQPAWLQQPLQPLQPLQRRRPGPGAGRQRAQRRSARPAPLLFNYQSSCRKHPPPRQPLPVRAARPDPPLSCSRPSRPSRLHLLPRPLFATGLGQHPAPGRKIPLIFLSSWKVAAGPGARPSPGPAPQPRGASTLARARRGAAIRGRYIIIHRPDTGNNYGL